VAIFDVDNFKTVNARARIASAKALPFIRDLLSK
jgi:hypothetical protein